MYVTIIVRKHLSLLPLFCRCPPQCQSMWMMFTSPASWDKERTSPWPCSPRDHTTILLSTNRSPASAGIFGFGWHRGEYFYLSRVPRLGIIFFPCRNIQLGVFRAEIFILWCIVQKLLVRYRYMLHGHHNLLFGFDQCLWNASLSHGKWDKTMNYMQF